MCKKIKELDFGLENCEGIIIPIECFEKLSINSSEDLSILKDRDTINYMECTIKNSNLIKYSSTYSDNKTHPLDRLCQYEDITQIDIICDDNTRINLLVEWYDFLNYCNNNKNQQTEKIDYNTIHIKVEPYIQKYNILQLFDFETGTKFLGSDSKEYKLLENENGKYIAGVDILTQTIVQMDYQRIA